MRIHRLVWTLLICGSAQAAGSADFESLSEGMQGTSLAVGGITFLEPDQGTPTQAVFSIDDGTTLFAAMGPVAEFVSGKALGLGSFGTGPSFVNWTRFKSMRMRTGRIETSASLDVAYIVNMPGVGDYTPNMLTLQAKLRDQVVASATHQLHVLFAPTVVTFGAGSLSIADVEFDELRLIASGPVDSGAVNCRIDSVVIGEAPGLPADLNGDGVVNTLDLGILLSQWTIDGGPLCGPTFCLADINQDGVVNTLDLGILLSSWTL